VDYAGRKDQTQTAGIWRAVRGEGGHQCFWRHGRCSLTEGTGPTRQPVVLTAGMSIDIPVPQEWSLYRMGMTACVLARLRETDPRRCQWTERASTVALRFKRSTNR
jgi:hypothetical protein